MRDYVTDITPTPAPWSLRGTGYVLLYWFQHDARRAAAFTQPNLAGAWRGGLGSLTWMDYTDSPVGPYREVLFVPGLFDLNGRRDFSISRIFVETLGSVVGGRANWGIPKDLADFRTEQTADGTEFLSARVDGLPICDLIVHAVGPKITIDTAPLPLTIMQRHEGTIFRTPLRLKATVCWLDVLRAWTDETEAELPALPRRPLAALKLIDFRVTFPEPETEIDADYAAAVRLADRA